MKVTLYKDYTALNGKVFTKGTTLKVTQELAQELEEKGYLSEEKKISAPVTKPKRTTRKK